MYITPTDQTKVDAIIEACCEYYELEKQVLIDSRERSIIEMRQQCFYLIRLNTKLTEGDIACVFNKSRRPITYGVEQITHFKKTYQSTKHQLKDIVFKANDKTDYKFNFIIE